jgi:hypothetical protein
MSRSNKGIRDIVRDSNRFGSEIRPPSNGNQALSGGPKMAKINSSLN